MYKALPSIGGYWGVYYEYAPQSFEATAHLFLSNTEAEVLAMELNGMVATA